MGVGIKPTYTVDLGSSYDREGKERVTAGGNIRFRCACLLYGKRDLDR